jgi:hypothetical protein
VRQNGLHTHIFDSPTSACCTGLVKRFVAIARQAGISNISEGMSLNVLSEDLGRRQIRASRFLVDSQGGAAKGRNMIGTAVRGRVSRSRNCEAGCEWPGGLIWFDLV